MTGRERNEERTTMNSTRTTTMNSTRTAAPTVRPLRLRALHAILALACALAGSLALAATPAAAKVIHQFEGSFNGSERPTYGAFQYVLPSDAVDRSNGDVWVTEAKYGGFAGKADAVNEFNDKGIYAGVQLTGAGTPQKEFNFGDGSFPGIAVDNSSGAHKGDLYVSDTGNDVVNRFSESGTFECQITGKTPASAEEITHECNAAAGSQPASGPGIEPSGLAVDSAGDLYVADRLHAVVNEFGPKGEFLKVFTDPHLSEGSGVGTIAVNSSGDLYVTVFGKYIIKFNSVGQASVFVGEGEEAEAYGVTVNPQNDYVYVNRRVVNPATKQNEQRLVEYDASGQLFDVFGREGEAAGLAVGPTGRLYAAELVSFTGAEVDIYSQDIVVPDATTEAATEVEESTATLHGHLDPDTVHGGTQIEKCQFEYGPTEAYGETAPCTPGPNYSTPADVSAAIAKLAPKSLYHFRLEAAESNGIPSYGEDQVLMTPGPPSIEKPSAEALETAVVFRAQIDPWGSETDCHVQYVSAEAFKSSEWTNATTVPCHTQGPSGLTEDLGSGFGDVSVNARVSGLARAAVYHWRFLAANHSGLTVTPDSAFETFNIEEVKLEDVKSGYVRNIPGYRQYEWVSGEPSTQAGERPGDVVTTIALNKTNVASKGGVEQGEEGGQATATNTRDIETALPPGLVGNPTALPMCSHLLVTQEKCPPQTQVGTIWIYGSKTNFGSGHGEEQWAYPATPLYNVEPNGPYPAEFGAFIEGQAGAWIHFHVRSGSDYGVTADAIKIISAIAIEEVKLVVWGVPASHAHDGEGERQHCGKVPCPDPEPDEKPFLTNPTSCAGPQSARVELDSWQEPESWLTASTVLPGGGFTGCGKLPFEPTLEARPTSTLADSPSGLNVDLHLPSPEACKEEGGKVECELAEAQLRDATVTLPAGMVVDPSSADGLEACSEAQVGYLAQKSVEVGYQQFTPGAAECPNSSKVGNVEVDTPAIAHPLPGAVYVAAQGANPFKSLLALYVAVYDPATGVVIKLAGKVSLDPVTGRLATTFDENPQLPFNDFKLDFFGGSRAALTTPFTCGSYAASSVLTPWSAPEGKDAEPSSLPFGVTGPGGGACVDSEAQAPNAPVFEAGTASPVAGSYSPFVLKLKREDASQRFSGLNVTLPPGLIGKIAGIEQCPQADIEAAQARDHEGEGAVEFAHPSCPAGSEVGVVHVGTGSGAPYYVSGHAYFAGPYEGAPFSLVIVTPAVAGPFDFGTVVVRAALFINPSTAQVTVKSDPFPRILDGVPLDIREVDVDMSRSQFTLNPTSCAAMAVTGEESSAAGNTAILSDGFQAGGCATLPFKPGFTVSTSAKATRADGTSIMFKITYPASALGKEAWLSAAKFEFPKQLPARLSTLQKSCPAATFNANPAACPGPSKIGTAVVHTQLLPVPLEGPVYFVSNGNAKFPEAVLVLQGDGVTVDLHSETFINEKTGVTSATLPAIPGVPFEEASVTLPAGPYSEFTANANLCATSKTVTVKKKAILKSKGHKKIVTRKVKKNVTSPLALSMPTTFTGQNGAQITQKTPITVTECPKVVKSKAKKHKKYEKHKTGKKRG